MIEYIDTGTIAMVVDITFNIAPLSENFNITDTRSPENVKSITIRNCKMSTEWSQFW